MMHMYTAVSSIAAHLSSQAVALDCRTKAHLSLEASCLEYPVNIVN